MLFDTAYKTRYFITQYNDMYYRISVVKNCRNSGVEIPPKFSKVVSQETSPEEVERISISRTRRRIREYVFANPFTYFATLTINSDFADRFHLEECQQKLKKIIKSIKRKHPDFIYLFITERHKNGAFHFHGLVSGIDFYTNENGYLSNKDFDKLGFNSFSKIRDFNKTCNYILKYITKDCVRNEKNQVFIFSKDLKKADRYEIKNIDFPFIHDNKYENDFVIQYDCYNDSNKIITKKC